jgi:anthranilate phosphoribosyltransferase
MINFDRTIIKPFNWPEPGLELDECRNIIIENREEIAEVFQKILDGEKHSTYINAEILEERMQDFFMDSMNLPY